MRARLQKHGELVPENFTPTVPAYPARGSAKLPSPQYTAQLALLDIPIAAPLPERATPLAADPNAIALNDDDDEGGRAARDAQLPLAARVDPNEINLDDL